MFGSLISLNIFCMMAVSHRSSKRRLDLILPIYILKLKSLDSPKLYVIVITPLMYKDTDIIINVKINVALRENASRTRYTIKIKLKLRKWVLEKKSFQLSFERREWAGWSDNGRKTVPHALWNSAVFFYILFNELKCLIDGWRLYMQRLKWNYHKKCCAALK